VQSLDEEVREEAEHDTPSGTCPLHRRVPQSHSPPVFTEMAVGWRAYHPSISIPPAGQRADSDAEYRWRTLRRSYRHGKTMVAASRSTPQQGCPMHRWRLPVLPADYAHHLLVKTVGECDETLRLDRIDTGARAQPDENEMSRRRRRVQTDWIEWFEWSGWLDYWLECLLALAMSLSLAYGPVVTRNPLDGEGKRTNSSRGGHQSCTDCYLTLRAGVLAWTDGLIVCSSSTTCATRTNALPMFQGIV
jgi:hypothetical protein